MAETLRDKLKSAYGIDIEIFAKCSNLLEGLKFNPFTWYPNISRKQLSDLIRNLGGKEIATYDQLKEIDKEEYKNIFWLRNPTDKLEVYEPRPSWVTVISDEGVPPESDWDSVKAKELGVKHINEKEFIDLIVEKGKSYKPIARKDWLEAPPPPVLDRPYEYSPYGYNYFPDALELYERPATFYVVKIKVPMNDGSTRIVHKPGIAIDNVKGKVNSRYSSKAPLDVVIELKNLNRLIAKELEIRMQDILRLVPWYGYQYPEYSEASDILHANWSKECSFLNDFVLKRKINYAKEREKRVDLLDKSFLSRFTPVPDIPDSWNQKYGLREWRIFDGSDEELKELVSRTLKIVENYFENEGKERMEHNDFFYGFVNLKNEG